MELHLRRLCDKKVKHCRGECGVNITAQTVMLVKSFGDISFYDKQTGKYTVKKGSHYIHFLENCLKDYDAIQTNHCYGPNDGFPYGKLVLDPASKAQISQIDVDFLKNMGVRV